MPIRALRHVCQRQEDAGGGGGAAHGVEDVAETVGGLSHEQVDNVHSGGCDRGCFGLGAGVCDGVVTMAALEIEFGPKSLAVLNRLIEALKGTTAAKDNAALNELMTRKQAAKFLVVCQNTFSAWVQNGVISKGIALSERNQRWQKSELLDFAERARREVA